MVIKTTISDEEFADQPHTTQHTLMFRAVEALHESIDTLHGKIDVQQEKCDKHYDERYVKKSWFHSKITYGFIGAAFILFAIFKAFSAFGDTQTINTLPQADTSFISDVQTFLGQEAAERSQLRTPSFNVITSGGTASTSGTLTHTIAATVGFPNGYYVSQASVSHTYGATKDTYVFLRDDDDRNVSITGYTITYDDYFVFATSGTGSSQPSTPTGCLVLFKAVTNGTSITTVTDLRPNQVYVIDTSEADQGAAATGSGKTIYDVAQEVGTSAYAIVEVRGTATFDTSLDLSSYPYFYVHIIPGGRIDRTTGDETVTIYNPSNLLVSERQQIVSAGMLSFATAGTLYGEWWGAKADNGTTDNGVPFNLAGAAALASYSKIKLNSGYYHFDTTWTVSGFFDIEGNGWTTYLITDSNIPIITIDTSLNQTIGAQIKSLHFQDQNSGTRTSVAGIKITGTTSNHMGYCKFDDLFFEGTYYGFYVDKDTDDSGENYIDWNTFNNIKTTNSGSNQVEHAIYFYNGSGTGNVFSNCALVFNTSGIEWVANNGTNVGDIVITGVQFGGSGTGVKGASGASYKNNVIINACQFDAGVTTAYDFDGYTSLHLGGNIPGIPATTSPNLPNCSYIGGNIEGSEIIATYYFATTGIGINGTEDIFDITMHTENWGLVVEIVSSGFMQGIGPAVTCTRYMLLSHSTGIDITQIEQTQDGVSTALISHSTSLSANVLTIRATIVSSAVNTNIETLVRVIGAHYEVTAP